jgi:hypothetical protein
MPRPARMRISRGRTGHAGKEDGEEKQAVDCHHAEKENPVQEKLQHRLAAHSRIAATGYSRRLAARHTGASHILRANAPVNAGDGRHEVEGITQPLLERLQRGRESHKIGRFLPSECK